MHTMSSIKPTSDEIAKQTSELNSGPSGSLENPSRDGRGGGGFRGGYGGDLLNK